MEVKKGYKQTEVGQIPSDWTFVPVGHMGWVVTGKALAVNGPGKQRPYLRTKNVFDGRIEIEDVLTMPITDEQFAQFQVRRGDVLLNEGQSLELVGRCAMYRNEYPEPCGIQNQLLRFRAKPGVSGEFASHLFRRCQQSGIFARVALQTTSIAHLGGSRFERLQLAWPPTLAEQEAIAGALSDADAWFESLEQLIAKKQQIKQGTMQELLTGKTRLPGFSGEWETKRLGEVADVVMGQSPRSSNYNSEGVGLPLIQGNADISNRRTIKRIFSSQLTKLGRSGDVLLSVRAPVGEVALTMFDVCLGRGVCAIRSKGNFLYHALIATEHTWKAYSKGSTFDSVNSTDVRAFGILVPPSTEEQSSIATVLSDMDAEIETLEAKLAKARQIKQGMMQELLTGRIRLVAAHGSD